MTKKQRLFAGMGVVQRSQSGFSKEQLAKQIGFKLGCRMTARDVSESAVMHS